MKSTQYRNALVTGASSGIGRAIAKRLVEDGLHVYAVGRDAAALDELAAGGGVTPITLDLRDPTPLNGVFAGTEVDVVVNNAGLLPALKKFDACSTADIDSMIDINLGAPLRLAHMALEGMMQRKRGHLFFVGSSAGRFPHPNTAVYGATKAAVSMFCDSLRCDLLGSRVRVTEIAPGRVQTNLYRTALGEQLANEKLYAGYRSIQPEDIAELISTALRLPDSVDVSRLEVFPTDQAPGGSQIVSTEA
ncbi:short-chain dehydrogenase/reductase SDR [Caballeronia glebae]|uniref:Short-chain dehydrogenase/reductase SDR n=1 Tax=Caballeronia glebae TaxID=1777143 RepID=A0A158AZM0_9BURK|nr:SDR family oxidoreductase [Caballeronia glebae]SAK63100.1 short-chain dehydrogenase/reductase SDR [Caballeronia glebae]